MKTWKECEGLARKEVVSRCAGYKFENALIAVSDYWFSVVNGDHSSPERYAINVEGFSACLEVASKLWNETARKYWPADGNVTIGNCPAKSTAVAAMNYFHRVQPSLINGPMADVKAYGDNTVTIEQLKLFYQLMKEHFLDIGIPAKPGEVAGIMDAIELHIGAEAEVARSTQASIASKRIGHLRELFLKVGDDPKLLKDATIEGGLILGPLFEAGILPGNEATQMYLDEVNKLRNAVDRLGDDSLVNFCHQGLFQHTAQWTSDKQRLILHKVSDNGEGVSCWSTSKDDTNRQSHQYASFCAELIEFLESPTTYQTSNLAKCEVEKQPVAPVVKLANGLDRSKQEFVWFGDRYDWLTETMMDALEVLFRAFQKQSKVWPDEMENKIGRLPDGGFFKVFAVDRAGWAKVHPVRKIVGGRANSGWYLIEQNCSQT